MSSLREAKPPKPQPSDQEQKSTAPAQEASGVTLGPRDRLIGQLYIEGDLHVNGTLEGTVEATGDVDVGEGATVTASVAGREVSISGQVNGAVTASKKLVVARSGSLIGDVRVPRLAIQDGATFSGNVSMTPAGQAGPNLAPPAPPAPSMTSAPEPAPTPAAADGPAAAAGGDSKVQEKAKPKRR